MAASTVTWPLAPQLARSQDALPEGDGWSYEPKLDGFRVIVFVDGDEHRLQSRNGKPLDRYFPELRFPPGNYVLDGELVVMDGGGEPDFEALQERIHPAASRVARLAEEKPAGLVAFDLLAENGEPLLDLPFRERRQRLEQLVRPPVRLIDHTTSSADAARWLQHGEGVVAKQLDAPYRPGERVGMVKIKRRRTIDCVVMGWRMHTSGDRVGSLILGLYEPDGRLRQVGHTAGFTARRAKELLDVVRPLETGKTGQGPPNRWAASRDVAWHELQPTLVAEVSYDHASGGHIRHGARLVAFRDDKRPEECTADQLQ